LLKLSSPQFLLHDAVIRVEATPSRTLTLFLDSNGHFDVEDPFGTSERATYVPGSFPDGSSVPLIDWSATPLQTVEVIAAYIDPQNKIVTPPISGSALFQLNYTSAFDGVAMNWSHPTVWGRTDSEPDFELQSTFVPFSTDDNRTARVPMKCWDYGGFTLVTVTHGTAPNQFFADMRVPKDDHGNLLPDAGWKAAGYGVDVPVVDSGLSAADDDDASPSVSGPPQNLGLVGDGLSRFEEYRGFMIGGFHRRTQPNVKDLFASSAIVWLGASIGLQYAFPNLSAAGVLTHQVIGFDESLTPEYSLDRIINFGFGNAGYGGPIPHADQRAVRARLGPADGFLAFTFNAPNGCATGGMVPNTTLMIDINGPAHDFEGQAYGNGAPQIINEIKRSLGHEIGHSIHVAHRPANYPPEFACYDGAIVGTADSTMSNMWFSGPDQNDPRSEYNPQDVAQIRLRVP
jgi:hypothetical protein